LESWVEAGQDSARFWHLTLREISIVMAGAAKRIEREQLFLEMTAWQSARLAMIGFHSPKKFPEFSKVSSAKTRRRRQNWEEQKAVVQMMNAAFGGKVH
jgi:hypothetical protein